MDGHGRYILDGKIPVPCEDLHQWAEWVEGNIENRVVKNEWVGDYWVSTVFLALDHNFLPGGPPRLFETMIFRNATNEDVKKWAENSAALGHRVPCPPHISVDDAPVWRTATWELALETHAEGVAWAKTQLS